MSLHTILFLSLFFKVLEGAFFLHEKGQGEEAKLQYIQLSTALEEFVSHLFDDWVTTVEKDLQRYLDVPLMVKSTSKYARIELGFSNMLQKLFGEMQSWERLRFEVPHYAAPVYSRCEQLRVMRENVLLIVRDYNSIIGSLRPSERALFRERIHALDKKLHPGFTKLTWASEGVQEFFITDCRTQAMKLQALINSYKTANRKIGGSCRTISEMLFIRLDGKRVYKENEFSEEQYRNCMTVQHRVQEIHDEIASIMKETFQVKIHQANWYFKLFVLFTHQVFRGDGGDVHSHWLQYTDHMDRMVEEAFRLNVKWSLQELSRAINGDGKTTPNPLFRVEVVLDKQVIN